VSLNIYQVYYSCSKCTQGIECRDLIVELGCRIVVLDHHRSRFVFVPSVGGVVEASIKFIRPVPSADKVQSVEIFLSS